MQTHATDLANLGGADGGGAAVRLVVLGSGLPVTSALPSEGEVVVGRAENADVQIDEDSISRKHAIIRVGQRVTIEDLGSLNGTRVRDRSLQRGDIEELVPGEAFELGSVMCIVQRRQSAERSRRRAFKPHSYIEARLEEELDRVSRAAQGSAAVSSTIALLRVHFEGELPNGALDVVLAGSLASTDIAGEYGPGELEVLFLAVPWEQVERRCDLLVRGLRAHVDKVSTGLAMFPRDGRTAASLFTAANEQVRGARAPQEVVPVGAMAKLQKLVERVAKSEISIILHGETGVGKEVIARELHRASDRGSKPFVGINCAALSETLLESELFGHEKGAFSGAVATKPGLLEVAAQGTVFLDEVAEMSPAIQAKLLRVIEERQVMRVGGLSPRPIDVRFISASHRDLEESVEDGKFRQDLFFRLNGITLEIPPLRERTDEIEGLCRTFLLDACRRSKRLEVPSISPESIELFKTYWWPGNVRELRNVVERAQLLCSGSVITFEHLPVEKMLAHKRAPRVPLPPVRAEGSLAVRPSPSLAVVPPLAGAQSASLKDAIEEVERERILDALRTCAGNQTKAAQALGISRRTLLNRLDQFGLPRPRK